MHQPGSGADEVGRQVLTAEGAQARRLLRRQEHKPECRQYFALVELQCALQIFGPIGREAARRQPPRRLLAVAAAEGETQQAFALGQELVEIIGELARIEDAQQLDVAPLEHDAVVAGAPADMAAAWREAEARRPPGGPGRPPGAPAR